MISKVCVYASSSSALDKKYYEKSAELAEALADKGYDLIYGAGKIGIMGKVADVFLRREREVIGVIPEKLNLDWVVHKGLTKLYVVEDMRKRKELMENFSDAFIACPGGIGTFEELLEIFTLKQLGYHNKPIIIFNIHGFYSQLVSIFERLREENFMKDENTRLIKVTDNIEEIIAYLDNYKRPDTIKKWF